MNKRGWIKIVEVSIVVLLIVSTLLIVLNQTPKNVEEENSKISSEVNFILKEIQMNQTLRKEILDASPLPIVWDYFNLKDLGNVKETILRITPAYLSCEAQITEITGDYTFGSGESLKKNLYVQSTFISANYEKYSPRKIILRCNKI